MNDRKKSCGWALLALLLVSLHVAAQQPAVTSTASGNGSAVPRLISYSGVLKDATGRTLTGITGVTFLLYKDDQGGAPLWMETQNVVPDRTGHYSVQLGAASATGLPADLFVSGEARWLALQPSGEAEQPRVLLAAVPYAMKAADAETIGGLPPSAFVLAAPATANNAAPVENAASASSNSATPSTTSNVTTTGGTANTLAIFTGASTIGNSIITQTSTTGININGKLNLAPTGTATASKGYNSQSNNYTASVYNSGTAAAVNEKFLFQTEPVGNNTTSPSGSLHLLFGSGTGAPVETGLKIAANGLITFATGQTFPGLGSGTVTSVASGTGLTGGPITTSGTLSIDATQVPLLASSNTFIAGQTINTGGSPVNSLSVNNTSGAAAIYSVAAGAGVFGETTTNTALGGVMGMDGSSTGTGTGVYGNSSFGNGVYGNSSGGSGVYGNSPNGIGVYGSSTNTVGVFGQSSGNNAVEGFAHTNNGSGVAGFNDAQDATGVYGSNTNGYGFVTDSHVSQGRGMGGWAKAMAFVDPANGNATNGIKWCFNSQLPGSQASTWPCGMTYSRPVSGDYIIDFGFQVSDRFVLVTPVYTDTTPTIAHFLTVCFGPDGCSSTATQVQVIVDNSSTAPDSAFYIVVF